MFSSLDTLLSQAAMHLDDARHRERFMLWVDAVGGYWVCLGDRITLGQPNAQGTADVPILGDLSSRHACILRDGEGYVVQAWREVRVNGRLVQDVGWLGDGTRLQLGGSVRLLFRRPHPLSATARLEFLSRHRTQPSTDAVLLLAEACVLGPKPHSHVLCRDWNREVILFRRGQELYCRTDGPFEVDGVACSGECRIGRNSHIEGDRFSFNLEEIQ